MRISCPSCQTVYEVPDALLAGAPKAMRCARCAREWTVEPPAPEPTHPAPGAVAPPPLPEVAMPPPPRYAMPATPPEPATRERRFEAAPPRPARATGALIGWVLSLSLLAGLGFAAVTFRGGVMAAWPPSQRLFHSLGLR